MSSPANDKTDQPWPQPLSAWWLVGLLFLAGVFSVLDRAILNVVVDPVRADLGISEEQIGLLQGLAFGIFYAFMGIPMGLLADRKSRKWLVTIGITLWSLATIWSGYAQSFGELFAARLLVGLGEATLSPCAISMIADMFAPQKRGRPISVFMMGQGVANGASLSITGVILALAAAGGFAFMPMLAELAPWRAAFVICGAVGLLVALGFLFTKEPERRLLSTPVTTKARLPGVEEFAFLKRNASVLVPLYLGFAAMFMVVYGSGSWNPAMLMRVHEISTTDLFAILGPTTIAFSLIGPLVGGQLIDWSSRNKFYMARFKILAIAPLFAIPSVLAVYAPTPLIAMIMVASSSAPVAIMGTVMLATLQSLVPPQMRGISISMTLILNTFLGAALGPLLIASVTQRILGDDMLVGWSIAYVCVPGLIVASALYLLALRGMKRGLAEDSETAMMLVGKAER